jgi:hypothetical protein
MQKSFSEYIPAVFRWWWAMVVSGIGGVLGAVATTTDKGVLLPAWGWFVISVVALSVAQFLAFHKVRVQRDELKRQLDEANNKRADLLPLVLTPHAYAIGLSGMTGYPKEPENAAWLCLEVAVSPTNRAIDTLDLIIDGQTIPVNHWPGKNVTAFNAYFNVTEWRGKGKNQVELIAHAGEKMSRSGRIDVGFNIEPSGRSHRI